MKIQDKIVWITGASSGIGEALAYAFAGLGAKLVLSARRISELERVKQNCKSSGDNVLVLPLDLENHDELAEKARIVIAHFGRIDVLVNNGGVSQRALAKDAGLEIDKRLMNINYFGPVALTKAVLPYMLKQKSGNIIVLSSLTGKFGTPLRSAYAASKHALHGFFDSLRAECWQDGIGVLLVCPGYIKTNISINALKADGSPQNTMDKGQEQGILPEKLAEIIIDSMKKGKEEIVVGGREALGVYIKRFSPRLFSRIIKKQNVTG